MCITVEAVSHAADCTFDVTSATVIRLLVAFNMKTPVDIPHPYYTGKLHGSLTNSFVSFTSLLVMAAKERAVSGKLFVQLSILLISFTLDFFGLFTVAQTANLVYLCSRKELGHEHVYSKTIAVLQNDS